MSLTILAVTLMVTIEDSRISRLKAFKLNKKACLITIVTIEDSRISRLKGTC